MSNDKKPSAAELEKEIENLAQYITQAKTEIAAISLDTEQTGTDKNISHAQLELAEVVRHTEEATNTIMDKAEAIMAAAGAMGAAGTAINGSALEILEACSFQDITGQRIKKVLKTLEQVELRVGNLVKLFGGQLPEGMKFGEVETGAPKRADEALMNGPQLGKDKPSQDDIDKLFANS
jgi:chemotaxis protein CheZ